KTDKDEARVRLTLASGEVLVCDCALFAAGRQSNVDGLGLEALGIELGKRGLVVVNEKYQTNVPNIYAAGDVIGFPALASTSMEQARVAIVHAFDLKYKTSVAALLPYGIYTIPELSTIGVTEEECRTKSVPYEVGRAYFRNNARGQIIGDTKGLIKLVFDPGSLKLMAVYIEGGNDCEPPPLGMSVL